jgi:hypothetical protein
MADAHDHDEARLEEDVKFAEMAWTTATQGLNKEELKLESYRKLVEVNVKFLVQLQQQPRNAQQESDVDITTSNIRGLQNVSNQLHTIVEGLRKTCAKAQNAFVNAQIRYGRHREAKDHQAEERDRQREEGQQRRQQNPPNNEQSKSGFEKEDKPKARPRAESRSNDEPRKRTKSNHGGWYSVPENHKYDFSGWSEPPSPGYSPTSPRYRPSSPGYRPTSPGYNPQTDDYKYHSHQYTPPPRPRGAPRPAKPTTSKSKIVTEYLANLDSALADKSKFPEVPAWDCHDPVCKLKAASRALKACPCNIRSVFENTDVRYFRLKFHPDKFCSAKEDVKSMMQKKAQEVFVVLDSISNEGKG